jgi:hypothetical protein
MGVPAFYAIEYFAPDIQDYVLVSSESMHEDNAESE